LGHGADPGTASHSARARVIATNLQGAYGIRQVGRFHSGGPLTSNPEFLLQTQEGRVLDPERILVALRSNLGAKIGNPEHAPGSVVSIDPRAASNVHPLEVPADLAVRASRPDAPVQIYSAQADRYMNRVHNSNAQTAAYAAVSQPRYLSINNAFGRPWVANAPFGLKGAGSESVLDPDGVPLANAPSTAAGGVFAGAQTPRTSVAKAVRNGWWASLWNRRDSPQLTSGHIDRGAFGTALLGASPDGSGFAVFAVVTGAGAVVQVHVQDGVDGLAPAGTIDVGDEDPGVIGVAFKWSPERALFVADARRDRIAVLHLADDARQFKLDRVEYLQSAGLNRPVDLAAATPEIANPRFSSHTTLAGGSELYVANRGDGSIVRMRQDGDVVARAIVDVPGAGPISPDRLRSIAVSADAQRIWLVVQTPGGDESMLLEIDGFDAGGSFGDPAMVAASTSRRTRGPSEARDQGARLFATAFTPATGLGPLFNANSCVACHPGPGGASTRDEHFARRVARMAPGTGRILPIGGQPSTVAPRRSIRDLGDRTAPAADLPRAANVVSLRMPLPLTSAARLDEIPDAVIEAQAVAKGDGIKGRVQYVNAAGGVQRVGRYGWKADVATLQDMVAEALNNEMGISSELAAHPPPSAKDDGSMVRALTEFLRTLGTSTRPR
jgi:hypothetical protein